MSQSPTFVVPGWPRWGVVLPWARDPPTTFLFTTEILADTMKKRFCVYIDGLNLYYFLHHRYPELKWLDVVRLAENLLGVNYRISRVKYYTARFMDNQKSRWQKVYWEALETRKEVTIYEGKFKPVDKRGKPLDEWTRQMVRWVKQSVEEYLPPASPVPNIKIRTYEEKRTDVNLAVHLVRDALLKRFDAVAVVSNDSDFLEAIKIVNNETKLPIWLLSPTMADSGKRGPHGDLQAIITPDFVKRITKQDLKVAQFPQRIPNTNIIRPSEWE
ncbi:MAG: NYN domain-containing protein [Proteobacteria bacterium]|nr:NYN domain-containing protein [Pseudomonadota bacterium]